MIRSSSLKKSLQTILLGIGIGLAGLTLFQIASSFVGYPVLLVVNGYSMNPTLEQFDLLLMEWIEPSEVELDMIVAVDHRADGHFYEGYVVHRVVEMTEEEWEEGGQLLIRTKGDYNDYSDELVVIEDVAAKVKTSLPFIGFFLSPPVNVMIIIGFLYGAFRMGSDKSK